MLNTFTTSDLTRTSTGVWTVDALDGLGQSYLIQVYKVDSLLFCVCCEETQNTDELDGKVLFSKKQAFEVATNHANHFRDSWLECEGYDND